MKVIVVWAAPGVQDVVPVELSEGATVGAAVARSGLAATYGLDLARLTFAVFGKRRQPSAPVQDGDRVEVLRPLVAEPKEARRRRARGAPLPKAVPRIKRR